MIIFGLLVAILSFLISFKIPYAVFGIFAGVVLIAYYLAVKRERGEKLCPKES